MSSTLAPAQQRIIDDAAKLTKERLAGRAAKYDEGALNPTESWHDLWKQGFLAMSIPKDHGGMELDTPSWIRVLEEVAKGCTATAMTLHMHSTVLRFIGALGTPEQKSRYFPEVVEREKLFGSWGSEPGMSFARAFLMETTTTPMENGFKINGIKHFCTMEGAASYAIVWSALNGSDDMSTSLMMPLVPAERPGQEVISGWDPMGMRGTVSPSMKFQDCFVAPDEVLGQPGDILRSGLVESFGLGYAAIYLGAATTALEGMIEYCKNRTYNPNPLPISHEPLTQRHVGEISIQLDAARLVLYQCAEDWAAADVPNRGLLAAKAKYICAEAAVFATSKAIQVVGGRSALKNLPLERVFRDVRTSTLMPPSTDLTLGVIGRAQLGLLGAVFNTGGEKE